MAITKTYLACNLAPPDGNGLKAKIGVFLEDLIEVPNQWVDDAFRTARRNRSDSFFPSTGEILKVWGDIKADLERQKQEEDTRNQLKALPEYYPESLATDSSAYIRDPTPEKLAELKRKYPTAGF